MRKTHNIVLLIGLLLLLSSPGYAGSASVPFKGSSLHYTDSGKGVGALVLVHGWACNTTFWDLQTKDLSKDMRVIAIDLPGHGKSGQVKEAYTQELFAEAVKTVMDKAGVRTATLVGHSMGASVIRWVAHLYPEKVNGLIIVDGALFPYPSTKKEKDAWQSGLVDGFLTGFTGPDGEQYTANFIDTLHGKTTPKALKPMVKRKMMATPQDVRISAMTNFLKSEVWNVPQLRVPTMAIYAMSEDTPPDWNTILNTMFLGVEYTLLFGPGHFFMMERPVEVNGMIRGFMARSNLLGLS